MLNAASWLTNINPRSLMAVSLTSSSRRFLSPARHDKPASLIFVVARSNRARFVNRIKWRQVSLSMNWFRRKDNRERFCGCLNAFRKRPLVPVLETSTSWSRVSAPSCSRSSSRTLASRRNIERSEPRPLRCLNPPATSVLSRMSTPKFGKWPKLRNPAPVMFVPARLRISSRCRCSSLFSPESLILVSPSSSTVRFTTCARFPRSLSSIPESRRSSIRTWSNPFPAAVAIPRGSMRVGIRVLFFRRLRSSTAVEIR